MRAKVARRLRRQARDMCTGKTLDWHRTHLMEWVRKKVGSFVVEKPRVVVNPDTFRGIYREVKKAWRSQRLQS